MMVLGLENDGLDLSRGKGSLNRMTCQKKYLLVLVHCLLAMLAVTSVASAAVPGTLTQQGRLLDSDGAAVPDGQVSFTFTIYDAASGGADLWTETQDITTEDGFFSAQLGEVAAFPAELFDGATFLFLGVQVGSDDEMTPRQPITSVPFALKAGTADNADNATSADTAINATSADTAINATGDITPTSISVNGTQVVNSSGVWTGQIDFSDLVDVRAATTATATAVSNACAAGGVIVSGGCASSTGDWVEDSYPNTTKGANSWVCRCGGTSCTVQAYAVCLQ